MREWFSLYPRLFRSTRQKITPSKDPEAQIDNQPPTNMEVIMHEASASAISNNQLETNGNVAAKCQQLAAPCYVHQTLAPAAAASIGWTTSQQQIIQEKNGTPFTKTKNGESLDIMFQNITYTVNLGWRRGRKEILHSLNGRLPSKQLIALMGPSGAGKSTLLDVLSGFRITGVQGSVYVNGRIRDLDAFRRSSAYITQDDRLQPLLTVLENMHVAADLKLGTDTPRHEKETIIEEILTTLGLYEHMHTHSSRLSGGQKKRLSIALELVNNPTMLFLDEPTTGLDSSSCSQVVNLLKVLARQGRTIICTIHQPSASLFQMFDQVYVLAKGQCLYQGATNNLVPYLESVKLPCPMYHNPADYVIELACGEYGDDKIDALVQGTENGNSLKWFDNPNVLLDPKSLRALHPLKNSKKDEQGPQATSQFHQLAVLLKRGCIKVKRDSTLTHLRIMVNICTGLMLGSLFIEAGNDADRIIENYNLLFGCLIHHMMTTMMLTVLSFPAEMNILQKEHFNRWYSLKAYYTSVTIVDFPVSVLCCFLFSLIVYFMSDQPAEWVRFGMFFAISLLVGLVAQSFGLMIGAWFDVVNGTFLAPTLSVPMMMFAGFGVSLRDLPSYLYWGTYISYLRYGLEGYVNAIYGLNRGPLECHNDDLDFCYYKDPRKFLKDVVAMRDDRFWIDFGALCSIVIAMRLAAYYLLRWKLMASR